LAASTKVCLVIHPELQYLMLNLFGSSLPRKRESQAKKMQAHAPARLGHRIGPDVGTQLASQLLSTKELLAILQFSSMRT
jgi:hypothetical protein